MKHETMTFVRAYDQLNELVAAAYGRGKRKVKIDVDKAIDLLVTLSAGYEHDMSHAERSGYDRGWRDATRARNTATYQLDAERREVADRLRKVDLSAYFGSHAMLVAICRAVYNPTFGWTIEASETLRDELVHLLVGEVEKNGDWCMIDKQ